MNHDELRQAHRLQKVGREMCAKCQFGTEWPCDVIKLLDENAALRAALEDASNYVIAATGPGRYALLDRIDKALGDAS